MEHSGFVHLHVHSQYSLLDGVCRVKSLVQKAIDCKMPALAITDHGNIFGAVDFYSTATSAGLKPIIGVEAYVMPTGSRFDKNPANRIVNHLCLYAKNNEGYQNLLKLVSKAYLEGYYYFPRIDKELLRQYSKGLICTSACLKSEIAWNLRQGSYEAAIKAVDEHRSMFAPGDYYLELMDHGLEMQKKVNEGLIRIAKDLKLPLVATNDVHYLERSQSAAHDALLCIQTQTTLDDPKRMRLSNDQFYFKSAEEMKELFSWIPEAISNTVEVAEKCNVKMSFGEYHLPDFSPPDGLSKEQYLRKLCEEALPKRYGRETPEIRKRLEYELQVIDKIGFIGYFLIVWDFISFAKKSNIPVGPGRGSAAGSIVSYLLGITNLDPLKYNLLFERFLNPDRAGMPDIDIDFCYERRGEVINYVTRKYGEENVAQIITFGTMQAKAAIRDVGRVQGVAYTEVDRIAKLVPNTIGITIEEALEKEPQLADLYKKDRTARDIIETAKVLEGLNRHASTHAAGVVISDKPLNEYVPLFKPQDGGITTGYSMNEIAKIGLLKMDFLGLRTLTVIDETIKLVQRTRGIKINIDEIPLDDKKTYENLGKAATFGIFQLESSGMRDLLKKSKPSEFEDIIAILALYRPGPMGSGMLDDFIKRKRGEVQVKYDHPKLEPILKTTYGIIVYQEQVMQIPVTLAGFSLVQADHLRRAMSKKIPAVMEKMRIDFVQGCHIHSGITQEKANSLFDLIDYFSGYGFNRSHSAAYAIISYQTAYLKTNFPVEFMCALLNSERNNTDKIVEYVRECEAMGLCVLPPHVTTSFKSFSVIDDHTISYGLLALKNIGSSAIDSIVENRKDGLYISMVDLCKRVDTRLVNRKVLESLIKCGALDSFEGFRAQLIAVIDKALEVGMKTQREEASGQVSFFNMEGDSGGFNRQAENLPDIKEWTQTQILAFEKEILGFYISGHPLTHYKMEIKEFTDADSKTLARAFDGEDIRIVGLIEGVKLTNTRKTNERMAILTLEDLEGRFEAVVFPSSYVTLSHYLNEGEVVFIFGKVNKRDERSTIIVNDIKYIHDVYSAIKSINVNLAGLEKESLNVLRNKLLSFPGKVPVYLNLQTQSNKGVQIQVGKDLYVTPNEMLMNEIKEIVGQDAFSVTL